MQHHQNTSFIRQPRIVVVLALFHILSRPVTAVDYMDFSSTTKYCYSCMSEDFLLHWPYLDEVYYRPMNFTDHCFKIPAKVNIGMAPCSNSMCVTVIEPRILAGQHIGNNIIRGCFASVFKYGASPRAQSSPILDTSCSRMPAHRLLPPHMAARSSNRSVELCWCVGQLCNDYPSVPMNLGSAHRYKAPSDETDPRDVPTVLFAANEEACQVRWFGATPNSFST